MLHRERRGLSPVDIARNSTNDDDLVWSTRSSCVNFKNSTQHASAIICARIIESYRLAPLNLANEGGAGVPLGLEAPAPLLALEEDDSVPRAHLAAHLALGERVE